MYSKIHDFSKTKNQMPKKVKTFYLLMKNMHVDSKVFFFTDRGS